MKDKDQAQVGAKSSLLGSLDTRDPDQTADFLVGLGYEPYAVVNTVAERCNLDRSTAQRVVNEACARKQGGH